MTSNQKKLQTIDAVVVLLIIKKLITPVIRTDAYKVGLVNSVGMVIRTPNNDSEKAMLTLLDRFVFKLKRLLGTKLVQLNDFLYVQSSPNVYNQLQPSGNLEQRAEVIRISKDITRLQEQYKCDREYLVNVLLNEETRNYEGELCQN
jgi:hypothetical protein